MGTFTKTLVTIDNQYNYQNASLIISGNYFVDGTTSAFKSVIGSVFSVDTELQQGEFIGTFNGSMIEDKMSYSISQMTKEKSDLVWEAIREIEPYILGEQNKQ